MFFNVTRRFLFLHVVTSNLCRRYFLRDWRKSTLAYYNDKVAKTNHLRDARRALKKLFPKPESKQFDEAKEEYATNVVINKGKELILRDKPDYVADDDAEADDLMALTDKMRTKDVRGKAKKTSARERELGEDQRLYKGG